MLQGIFKKQEPRKFNYKSRYYDSEKANIRKQKILDGEKDTEVNFGDRFRRKVKENRKTTHNSMRKLIIMLAILALLIYILLSL
jgi:t-SNARE complex subunit (syntaxin)